MPSEPQETLPEVGSFRFEVYGSGRKGRRIASRFTLRCDAIGLHRNEILLLSAVGPETGIKALTAGLRASPAGRLVANFAGLPGAPTTPPTRALGR